MKRALLFFAVALSSVPAFATQAAECISIQRDGGVTPFLENNCNKAISVTWFDQGNCSAGCSDTVAAHSRSSITSMTGRYSIAACVAPQNVGSAWKGYGSYFCK